MEKERESERERERDRETRGGGGEGGRATSDILPLPSHPSSACPAARCAKGTAVIRDQEVRSGVGRHLGG
eukprot:3252231-Pyramimonas_sp.AAC.1